MRSFGVARPKSSIPADWPRQTNAYVITHKMEEKQISVASETAESERVEVSVTMIDLLYRMETSLFRQEM